MGRIFLSHTEKDAVIMEQIAQGLGDAGYETWYFERDVLPGMSYLKQVTKAMDSCDALALIISPNALDSSQITQEIIGAFERNKPFFPVLIGITPLELKERQPEWWHALSGIAMITAGTERLSTSIERIIEGLKARGIQPTKEEQAPVATASYTSGATIPKDVAVKELATRSSMEGERKQVTVLFADVVGFSSLSDKLDPEEVHDLIRKCIGFMVREIHRFEGTVAQFLGDGLMALFGAPIAHEDAPRCALYAALAIQRRLKEYAAELKQKGIEFAMRIGVNTGLVVVGRIGDDLTMEYTAVGDTVNLASRMESTAQPGTIQVTESTVRLTEGFFDFENLGEIQVKGKEQSINAYRVAGPRAAKTRLAACYGKGLTPFVGRTKELEHLNTCFDLVKEGHGQVVGVMGEPGMGKSRLIHEFIQGLHGGYSYFEGGCLHYGETIAYLPLLDIVKGYFDILEDDNEAAIKEKISNRSAQLGSLPKTIVSSLHEILSLTVRDEAYVKLEPMQKRERIFEAIKILLIAESHVKPLIVTIDDVHWIDKTSEEFLNYFIGGLAASRILLLLLYRPEYTSLWANKTYFSQIRVDQFSAKRSVELVQHLLVDGEVGQDLSDFIVNKAAGNPLYIEELTRSLLEKGSIKRKNHQYVLFLKHAHVPDTIQGIIASRLDHLEEKTKRILQLCSVIGREFSFHLLQALAGLQGELMSCLHLLQDMEIIYEKTLFPELEYMFKHALFQEVTYNSLLLKKRKELHALVGQTIEAVYADRLSEFCEMLAYHFSLSNDQQKAYQYLKLSGDKAAKSYANQEAIRFYKEAIQALDSLPRTMENKREKIHLFIEIMVILRFLGYPKGSQEFMDEAERFVLELGDERSLAEVCGMLGNYYTYKGNPQRGLVYAEKSFYVAERTEDIDIMVQSAERVCGARFFLGDCVKVVDIARRMLSLIEKHQRQKDLFTGGMNTYSAISALCGSSLAALGHFEEGAAMLEKGFQNAFEINDAYEKGVTQMHLSSMYCLKGDVENTADHAQESIKFLEEGGSRAVLGISLGNLGFAYYFRGDYETALIHCNKGITLQKEGISTAIPWCCWQMSLVYLAKGDIAHAMEYAQEALHTSLGYAKAWEGASWQLLGKITGEKGSAYIEEACDQILKGISISEERKLKPYAAMGYLFLGELFADDGQTEEALENLQKAVKIYQEMGCNARHYWMARTRKALSRIEAHP